MTQNNWEERFADLWTELKHEDRRYFLYPKIKSFIRTLLASQQSEFTRTLESEKEK